MGREPHSAGLGQPKRPVHTCVPCSLACVTSHRRRCREGGPLLESPECAGLGPGGTSSLLSPSSKGYCLYACPRPVARRRWLPRHLREQTKTLREHVGPACGRGPSRGLSARDCCGEQGARREGGLTWPGRPRVARMKENAGLQSGGRGAAGRGRERGPGGGGGGHRPALPCPALLGPALPRPSPACLSRPRPRPRPSPAPRALRSRRRPVAETAAPPLGQRGPALPGC